MQAKFQAAGVNLKQVRAPSERFSSFSQAFLEFIAHSPVSNVGYSPQWPRSAPVHPPQPGARRNPVLFLHPSPPSSKLVIALLALILHPPLLLLPLPRL